jgi:hypothetical protein
MGGGGGARFEREFWMRILDANSEREFWTRIRNANSGREFWMRILEGRCWSPKFAKGGAAEFVRRQTQKARADSAVRERPGAPFLPPPTLCFLFPRRLRGSGQI